jgi:membrane dipeptidase
MTGDDPPDHPPVVDGHTDALLSCYGGIRGGRPFRSRSERGHVDVERAREGGLAAAVFATFVPNSAAGMLGDPPDDEPYPRLDAKVARRETFDMLALLHSWAHDLDGFRVVTDVDDLAACVEGGAFGAVPHLEGAEAVQPDLANLDLLYAAGVRSIGPVWSRPNDFGEGVPLVHDSTPDTGGGLTDAGEALVDGCNERGIVVDCAHLTSEGFFDVADRSEDPLVVSHSAAYEVSPSARNLTDEQLEAVAESDGVVGLTLSVAQLHPGGESDRDLSLDVVADHVDHLVDVMGVEHVALGTDFDGATIPNAVGDASGLPAVLDAIADRGYDEDELAAICHENWLRVFDATW